MSRKNQVQPFSTIATKFYTENAYETSVALDDQTQHAFLTLLRKYVSRKFCYHSDAAAEAKITRANLRVAFQVDIWTLMEKRWTKSTSVPYKGEETPGESIGDVFDLEKYNLRVDSAVVEGKQVGHIEIPETQKKIACTTCDSLGKNPCKKCKGAGLIDSKPCSNCKQTGFLTCSKCLGSGYILQKSEMYCKRYTIHSATYPKNTFLPDECINKCKGKFEFFDDDVLYEGETLWSNFETLQSLILEQSPYDFCKIIEKQFKEYHLDKVDKSIRIRRVKCSIQRIDVVDLDYQAGYYTNKVNNQKGTNTFTFLLYGRDLENNPEIFENDYPLNTCGCCGHACAHRSRCCSIS